jgi:hypothetical protein
MYSDLLCADPHLHSAPQDTCGSDATLGGWRMNTAGKNRAPLCPWHISSAPSSLHFGDEFSEARASSFPGLAHDSAPPVCLSPTCHTLLMCNSWWATWDPGPGDSMMNFPFQRTPTSERDGTQHPACFSIYRQAKPALGSSTAEGASWQRDMVKVSGRVSQDHSYS